MVVTVGVMALLQSSVVVEEWSSRMKLYYQIRFLKINFGRE